MLYFRAGYLFYLFTNIIYLINLAKSSSFSNLLSETSPKFSSVGFSASEPWSTAVPVCSHRVYKGIFLQSSENVFFLIPTQEQERLQQQQQQQQLQQELFSYEQNEHLRQLQEQKELLQQQINQQLQQRQLAQQQRSQSVLGQPSLAGLQLQSQVGEIVPFQLACLANILSHNEDRYTNGLKS